jgi:spore germination protein YaaH/putative cell wall-binding protein
MKLQKENTMLKTQRLLFVVAIFIAIQLISLKASAAAITVRLSGANRFETAIKISQDTWLNSNYVVIASGENFPDALCAAPLAKKYNAPILLTPHNGLTAEILQEIQRLGAKNAFIVGGPGVVSLDTEDQLSILNIQVTRIQGQDRYETSSKVAQVIGTGNGVVIASGGNFPDALSIAPIAAAEQMPILLTNTNFLPQSVSRVALSGNVPKYFVVGGTGAISDNAVEPLTGYIRLSGSNRYKTNLAVINEFLSTLNLNNIYISTGVNFADALVGSAAAAQTSAPIILSDSYSSDVNSLIQSKLSVISSVKVLGGTAIVSNSLVQSLLSEVPPKIVLGYTTFYSPSDNSSYNSLVANSSLINQIATDTYTSDGAGNITGLLPAKQISYANSKNIDAFAMITNNFNGSIAKTLLENPSNRANLINNLLQTIKENNYKGVNVDLEGIKYYDRSYFTTFMSELYNTLHPLGYLVTIAVPAKTADILTDSWAGAYDYSQIANYSDEVVIMTYDEHYAGGAPGPVASAGWVQSVVNYAVKYIPKQKLLLGLAAYGYDWSSNGSAAKACSLNQIYSIAAKYGAQIKWDNTSDTSYFNYTDSSGIYHSVWFENSTSIAFKLDMVNNNNLAGVALWRIGLENSDYWTAIKTKFNL